MSHAHDTVRRLAGQWLHPLPTVLAVVLLGACASAPAPTIQIALAEAAVGRADSAATRDDAAVHLRAAQDKLVAARSALLAGDTVRAGQLAEQVELDARVAELHAEAERASRAAQDTQDAARVLRDEIARKAPR